MVELKHKAIYIPGIYMLMEYAGGGDKISTFHPGQTLEHPNIVIKGPDVGVDEELAHYYFLQLISGMVTP